MNPWLAFLLGVMIGGAGGIFLMACLQMYRKEEKEIKRPS
jgi:hypothetical protein